MSNYTGLLTGDYYFQLNTGNGFLEATYDQVINVKTSYDSDRDYPHGLRRCYEPSIGFDYFCSVQSGLCTDFSVGADTFRLKKGYNEPSENCCTINSITWDQCDNLSVGVMGDNVYSVANSILGGPNHLWNSENNNILGVSNLLCDSNFNSILGPGNTINCACNTNVLGASNYINNENRSTFFGYLNTSYGGNSNFVNGSYNVICTQGAHYNGVILGGLSNQLYGTMNTIMNGLGHKIGAPDEVVSETNENHSLIGMGRQHHILGSNSTIMNGNFNQIGGHNNFIGGGYYSCITVTNYDLENNPGVFDSIQDEVPRGNFIGNGYYNKILDWVKKTTK